MRLRAGPATIEVAVLAPDLFRVGLFGHGRPPEYRSEAVEPRDWAPPSVEIHEDHDELRLSTPSAIARLQLRPLRIGFEDSSGRRFGQDDPRFGMGFIEPKTTAHPTLAALESSARVYKLRPATERYFGCGERTGGLEKTDSHQTFWNVDPPTEHTASLDNLYTSIPFVLALDRGQAWGLFLDDAGRVEFDLAHEHPERSWFGEEAGDLVYYVFAGPTPRDVLEGYTELTGRTPLPPLWALGYHQSRWGYRGADELRQLARQFRERGIPCDALYLDIDYMDGYRVFTWDRQRFPDPKGLLDELRQQGFRVVTIVDPGVKVDEDYSVYQSGREADLYCKTAEGREYRNVVWPGLCAFPDFASSRAREWWGQQLEALTAQGVAGIWCDMNEPTVFVPNPSTMPGEVVHAANGEPSLHARIHNLYGSLMARATREGLQRLQPERRPFVISRAGYAGLQRQALHWTGDNSSWWEHLWMSMPQLQNLGLSGLAWVGVDVGGFSRDATGELLARWVEFGIFQPFCRNHSAWNTRRQDPWAFGESYEAHIRRMLELRQRLIPYLYSLFDECHRSGAPILRPLLFSYPDDEFTYTTADEFLLGEALLIAPIASAGAEYRHVYLPRGCWFHYWSGQRFDGPAHILAHAPLGQPALYVRADTPLPLWPVMGHVQERPADPLTIMLFPAGGQGDLTLYEDAGDGLEYQTGDYARTRIICSSSATRVTVRFNQQEGTFVPDRTTIELEIRGLSAPVEGVQIDDRSADGWRQEEARLTISLPASSLPRTVEVLGSQPTLE